MRTRALKPGFFLNEELAELVIPTRLLFAGLPALADREGRLEDRPRRIHGELFRYDFDLDVDRMLGELAEKGFIIRYEVDGQHYIQIVNFAKHQKPHPNEAQSVIPAPPGFEPVTTKDVSAYDQGDTSSDSGVDSGSPTGNAMVDPTEHHGTNGATPKTEPRKPSTRTSTRTRTEPSGDLEPAPAAGSSRAPARAAAAGGKTSGKDNLQRLKAAYGRHIRGAVPEALLREFRFWADELPEDPEWAEQALEYAFTEAAANQALRWTYIVGIFERLVRDGWILPAEWRPAGVT